MYFDLYLILNYILSIFTFKRNISHKKQDIFAVQNFLSLDKNIHSWNYHYSKDDKASPHL